MPTTAARRRWEALIAAALVLQLSVAATAAIRMREPAGCILDNRPAGALAGEVRRACDKAIRQVSSVWGRQWSREVVVVMPRTFDELLRELPRQPDLHAVAAVVDSRQRVVLNPVAFARLSATGREVVLAHEITHVATGDIQRPVPAWLAEGLADYVGFKGSGIPVVRAAAELAGQVRSGRLPTALPTDAAFDRADLAATYQQSWLAVSLLARLIGEAGMIRCYRAVQAGASVEAALAREDLTTQELTRRWRLDLQRQLG